MIVQYTNTIWKHHSTQIRHTLIKQNNENFAIKQAQMRLWLSLSFQRIDSRKGQFIEQSTQDTMAGEAAEMLS